MQKPMEKIFPESQQTKVEATLPSVLAVFETVFGKDVHFIILKTLSKQKSASLREIARTAAISPKNLINYMEPLMKQGVIVSYPVGWRRDVYEISAKYSFLRDFL